MNTGIQVPGIWYGVPATSVPVAKTNYPVPDIRVYTRSTPGILSQFHDCLMNVMTILHKICFMNTFIQLKHEYVNMNELELVSVFDCIPY